MHAILWSALCNSNIQLTWKQSTGTARDMKNNLRTFLGEAQDYKSPCTILSLKDWCTTRPAVSCEPHDLPIPCLELNSLDISGCLVLMTNLAFYDIGSWLVPFQDKDLLNFVRRSQTNTCLTFRQKECRLRLNFGWKLKRINLCWSLATWRWACVVFGWKNKMWYCHIIISTYYLMITVDMLCCRII